MALVSTAAHCHRLFFFKILLTCPCSNLCRWICRSPSSCREGEWSPGFLKAARSELQRVLGGSRKRIVLVFGSYSAGSWFLFAFCSLFLWFCSCFSLECFCGLCFYSLAGFGAQAVGAPCWAGWTPLWMFLGCSEFGVNIQSPGGVVLILKSRFSAKSSASEELRDWNFQMWLPWSLNIKLRLCLLEGSFKHWSTLSHQRKGLGLGAPGCTRMNTGPC